MRNRLSLAVAALIIPAVTALSLSSPAAAAAPGDLVISEVMQNPSAVFDNAGEWFEITNVSAAAIDLNGWTIADDGSDSHVITSSVVVAPGGRVVLGNNTDTGTNGGVTVDYSYGGSFFLSNGADELIVTDTGAVEIDRIEWDGGATWPDPNGASMNLDPASTNAVANDLGANWCTATAPYGAGDLGTPGTANTSCAGDTLVISEVMQNPSAVFDSVGEWFEITNVSAAAIDLNGWTIADNDSDSHVITSSVVVAPGGRVVLGNNTDTGTNGGATVDYSYGGSFFLSNGADELVLSDTGAVEIDRIEWDGGATWPDPNGASMNLDPSSTNTVANDLGANWCTATAPYGLGDSGTPGTANTSCDVPTPAATIHEVQGSGDSVAITTPVIVQAVVTSLFERDDVLDGFFIQEEDGDADADATTSEGIFVFCRGNCPIGLATGDLVTVEGTPTDFFGMSQISGSITVDSSDNPLPTATPITLPAAASTTAPGTFEATEGMIVTFPGALAVSEYFQLARFGQVTLTESARPFQFTDQNAPDVGGYAAFLDDLATRRIILDDDNNDNNDNISDGPDEPYYYPTGGLSVGNRFRGGDTITGLTGVLHWSFAGSSGTDAWRVRPISDIDYAFQSTNPAPASPDDVGGSVSAGSFNVLNLFSTIDTTSSGSSGPCGPSGTLDCRGADSAAELARQQAKIASAINEIDAEIVGLIELENDGDDASVSDLVDQLNTLAGPGSYDYVPTGFIGEDAIKVGLIYQPAQVTPVGDYAILDSSVDARFLDSKNRPMLVQTFVQNATAAQVTVAVNHLKSKGSPCDDVGDPGLNDGQANCPGTRTAAAEAIADFLAGDPTDASDADILLLGDLNSYAMEAPITALKDAGYSDLLDALAGPDAYTYLFDGQLGYLDYAMANTTLFSQVTGVTAWHINADEIPVFDYNDGILDAGERSFERESAVLPVFAPDPLRSSDHDPVIVGLELEVDLAGVIATLIDRVDELEDDGALNKGQAKSLRTSLTQALRQIDRGRYNGASGILTGVIEQLGDFVDDGVLTADQAHDLIVLATAVRNSIS